ncbi:hypothetical protein LOK49_LG03G01614 [Camellia lanceoleosa]|uniref:Uncharacterized protein n=1 Tax=Camellia lanceoleosa TaxID=1840588 RepID=A0ACC0I6Q0_9ERIC|nr:hypothetical protein LOK49_LG03G01614 [Camellia lanceoleosa]
MAGTLPGVEYARRRRFHQTSRWSESPTTAAFGSTRQSSFCLHSSNHESHLSSISNSLQRSTQRKVYEDEKLGGEARAAKVRLDERLRAQWNSETKRNNSQEKLRCMEGRRTMMATKDLQKEVFGLKKTLVGSRRFMSWAKLGWKGSEEQEECAICLENFKNGQTLVHLPCTHRFHSRKIEVYGGKKNNDGNKGFGKRGDWIEENTSGLKEVHELGKVGVEGLRRPRRVCHLFGTFQEWPDPGSPSIHPPVPF